MPEDIGKKNKENKEVATKEAPRAEELTRRIQQVQELLKGRGVQFDTFLEDLLRKKIASLLELTEPYVKANISKTEDVQGLSTNQATQADIKRGNIISFQLEGISFVAFYAHGTYTFFLGRNMKLIEIRSIYDLARCLDTEEGS